MQALLKRPGCPQVRMAVVLSHIGFTLSRFHACAFAMLQALLQRLGADRLRVFSVAHAEGEAAAGGERLLQHLRWPCTLRQALSVGRRPPSPLMPYKAFTSTWFSKV